MTSPKHQRTRIYRGTPQNLRILARALIRGELVAVPTETVYGLAADALNAAACRAIFRAKGRPANDPLIVHIHDLRQIDALAECPPEVHALAQAFWPGPLTVVLPKKAAVPDIVTSGQPSVAIRMPAHRLFRRLLKLSGRALAAPSANPFGYVSPTSAEHVADGLGGKIRHILDGGPCAIGLESTILDLRNARRPAILRPGAIDAAAIRHVLRRPVRDTRAKVASPMKSAIAPGLLSRHYSPRTPVVLHRALPRASSTSRSANTARVYLFKPRVGADTPNTFWLAEPQGGLPKAAQALFGTLRKLDRLGLGAIHMEEAKGKSALALAINDRLRRAAAKR